ncbi:hypothetical protein SD074_05590 [Prolixibacter sp. SD074]|jgi:hypothetical protein|nr:hypothetical protein SD074_05590 [Prolixibacter sp. SD074]
MIFIFLFASPGGAGIVDDYSSPEKLIKIETSLKNSPATQQLVKHWLIGGTEGYITAWYYHDKLFLLEESSSEEGGMMKQSYFIDDQQLLMASFIRMEYGYSPQPDEVRFIDIRRCYDDGTLQTMFRRSDFLKHLTRNWTMALNEETNVPFEKVDFQQGAYYAMDLRQLEYLRLRWEKQGVLLLMEHASNMQQDQPLEATAPLLAQK